MILEAKPGLMSMPLNNLGNERSRESDFTSLQQQSLLDLWRSLDFRTTCEDGDTLIRAIQTNRFNLCRRLGVEKIAVEILNYTNQRVEGLKGD